MTSDAQTQSHQIVVAIGEREQLTVLSAVAVPFARSRADAGVPLYVGVDEERAARLNTPSDMGDVILSPDTP
ncbi:MAG: hypothetical protein A2Y73_07050 [Chloroflexi bacterium RBG_13_56_8]|nr:MAG: hypothetical protein A2Y73_07050 [Chloroflexi bacterium RBG_13_56_8]